MRSIVWILLAIVLSIPAHGQYINSCTGSAGNFTTPSCVINGVTAGHQIIVIFNNDIQTFSASDSFGTIYAAIGPANDWNFIGQCGTVSGCAVYINEGTLTSSGNLIVTLTGSTNGPNIIVALEYANVGGLDSINANCAGDAIYCPTTGQSGLQTSGTFTVSTAPDFIINISFCGVQTFTGSGCTASPTPGGSYTQRITGGAFGFHWVVSDKHVLSNGSYTADDDLGGTTTTFTIIGVAFGDISTEFSGDAQIL